MEQRFQEYVEEREKNRNAIEALKAALAAHVAHPPSPPRSPRIPAQDYVLNVIEEPLLDVVHSSVKPLIEALRSEVVFFFGTQTTGSKASDASNQLGFQFGAPISAPAPGYLGAISHLGGGSVASSTVSSRNTSPGLTDNDSDATNATEDTSDDPQTSFMDSRAGEENETCIWESRSKALMFVSKEAAQGTKMTPNDWNSRGIGQLRVLKDKATGKTRVVFRVEPNASILINSHLVDSVEYESVPSTKSGAVRGALFYNGHLTRWVFKLKSPEMGVELAKVMEDNKRA